MLALVKPKPKLLSSVGFFREHGINAVGVAPLDIALLGDGKRQLGEQMLSRRHSLPTIIVTSTEAAKVLAALCKQHQLHGDAVYCIGETTAALLSAYFEVCHVPAQQTSEGFISEFFAPDTPVKFSQNRVLLLKGDGGRTLIQQALMARDIQLREINLYRRIPLVPPYCPEPFEWSHVDTLIVTSNELLTTLLSVLPSKTLQKKRLIVPSERIQSTAQTLGFTEIITSHGATNALLLGCVQELPRGRT